MVYFAERASDGAIKIGYTGNVHGRVGALAAECKCRVKLLATIPGTRDTERAMHRRFARAWVKGEWFRPTLGLMRFIRSCPTFWGDFRSRPLSRTVFGKLRLMSRDERYLRSSEIASRISALRGSRTMSLRFYLLCQPGHYWDACAILDVRRVAFVLGIDPDAVVGKRLHRSMRNAYQAPSKGRAEPKQDDGQQKPKKARK
jgi:hypothetical protein